MLHGRVMRAAVAVGFVAALAWLSIARLGPPSTKVAEGIGFSVDRAMADVRELARESRPTGSPANRRARRYIVEQLRAAGLEVQEQPGEPLAGRGAIARALVNIVARLKGTAGAGRAVMLVAHYDSVHSMMARGREDAPGAGDDAAGVAAILETARVVSKGPALRNDLIILITDAEEWGLYGARIFCDRHPWARDVGLVMNFEGRGTSGPSVMFETGDRHAWLVRELARAAPYPVASSLSYDIYRLMPNNTDFTIFRRAGMQGLNFAFIGGPGNYHTVRDDVGHLDVRSMAHHGTYALGLTRHFGNLDLSAAKQEGRAVWFNTLPPHMVVYSTRWVWALAGVVVLLFAGALVLVLRRGVAAVAGILWAQAAVIGSILLGAAATAAWWLLLPADWSRHQVGWMTLGGSVAALIPAGLLAWLVGRKVRGEEIVAAAGSWWVVLTLLSAAKLAGGSHLASWPAAFALLGVVWRTLAARPARGTWGELAIGLAVMIPTMLLIAPTLDLAATALTPMLTAPGAPGALKLATGALGALAVLAWWLGGVVIANIFGVPVEQPAVREVDAEGEV
jgi:hypothetical protein